MLFELIHFRMNVKLFHDFTVLDGTGTNRLFLNVYLITGTDVETGILVHYVILE